MKHLVTLAAVAAASLAVATPAMAQRGPVYGQDEEARFDAAQQRFDREYGQFQQALERYRAYKSRPIAPPPPPPPPRGGYSGYDPRDEEYYDASRDYRAPPPGYQERVLTQDDRIYRGQDGKYYCKRSDGTPGLIVGAAANLVMNLILIPRFGAFGAVVATVAAELLITIMFFAFCDGYLTLRVLFACGWKKIIAGAVMCAVVYGLGKLTFLWGPIHLALQVILGAAVYLVMLLLLRDDFVKRTVSEYLGRILHRRKAAPPEEESAGEIGEEIAGEIAEAAAETPEETAGPMTEEISGP